MKKIFLLSLLFLFAIIGCKHVATRRVAKSPMPPLPPGMRLKPNSDSRSIVNTGRNSRVYSPTDFALTTILLQQRTNLVLAWINGAPPFQAQLKTNVLSGWVDYGPSTLLRRITNPLPNSATAFFRIRSTAVSTGQLQWVKAVVASVARAQSVAADSSGNVTAVGGYSGSVSFGNTSYTGIDNAFVVKYGPQGGLLWSKSIGVEGFDNAMSVAVDSHDNIVVAGYFSSTVDFGGVSLTAPFTSLYSQDMFVAKYAPSGSLLWVRQFGGVHNDYSYSVALDASDNIILAGSIQSFNVDFGNGFVFSSGGAPNPALVKLSSSGATIWAKVLSGTQLAEPSGVAIDHSGDVVMAGAYQGSANLGGGALPATGRGSFVAKYAGSNGAHRWSKGFGDSSAEGARAITSDPNTGNVIVTGGYGGPTDFGGGPAPSNTGGAFLVAYTEAGNYLWHKTFGSGVSGNSDSGNGVQIYSDGNLLLTGLKGTPWYNTGSGTLWNLGYFVISFAVSGSGPPTTNWIKLPDAGSTGSSRGLGISRDAAQNALAAGQFGSGTVNFGGSNLVTTFAYSGFVVKYSK